MQTCLLGVVGAVFVTTLAGQSTQSLIDGRVVDRTTRRALANATVEAACSDPEIRRYTVTGKTGNFAFPELPPGLYQLAVKASSYQSREIHELRLNVAGYLNVDFELRPLSDIWEKGRYRSAIFRNDSVLTFFGPDVDPSYSGYFEPERAGAGQLEPSLSEVISPRLIDSLPLAGRDVYTAIVLLPGIASDTTTTRSIGLSANGQRPTSSNFLLDGVDDNNHVITGPMLALAPETVQEYRVSTSNFSAEYGGVTGYIANAITRSATEQWHGVAYLSAKNSVLNANTFTRNANVLPKTPYGDLQPGFWAGGPLPFRHWAFSSALDRFHAHSASDPDLYSLPTEQFFQSLPAGSFARSLLDQHKPRFWAPGAGIAGLVSAGAPIGLNRYTAMGRLDYVPLPRHRFLFRGAASRLTNLYFRWNAYGQSPLKLNTVGGAAIYDAVWSPAFTTELRLGVHRDRLGWGLIDSGLPGFTVSAGPELPGSCCGTAYEDRSLTTSADFGGTWAGGRHVLKAGGGWAGTRMQDRFEFEPHGVFHFRSADAFRQDQPFLLEAIISRTGLQNGQYEPASTRRRYLRSRSHAYVQEDLRLTPNITLNAGARYEFFGPPVADGRTKDTYVAVAAGVPLQHLTARRGEPVFSADSGTWAGRFAASYSPVWRRHALVIRTGYGTFHESMYDNLWSAATVNDYQIGAFNTLTCPVAPSQGGPPTAILQAKCFAGASDFLDLTAFASPMRIPTVHSFYAGAQFQPARGWAVEVNGLGSAGHRLFSTDVVNRYSAVGRPVNLPDVYYHANDGRSHNAAMTASVRWQSARAGARLYYTWSHSIDNQSDPLLGAFFDLGFSNQTGLGGKQYYGAFTFQNKPEADIGNSDFDQRHNFAAFSYWDIPALHRGRLRALSRGWTLSETFVVRSGLPYSVFAGDQNCHPLCNTRADLVNPAVLYFPGPSRDAAPGTRQLLNPDAFRAPAPGSNGNTGRNVFRGPGFWNFDLSIARTFTVREKMRIELRADAFNAFNHANLGPPESYWGESGDARNQNFGAAPHGRIEKAGFPALNPLIENARQIQILLRIRF